MMKTIKMPPPRGEHGYTVTWQHVTKAGVPATSQLRRTAAVLISWMGGREGTVMKCRYCDQEIIWDGRFWVIGPLDSVILGRDVCQSPKSPDFRHKPRAD